MRSADAAQADLTLLLPPSETKHSGGDGSPLDVAALGFPRLNPVRTQLLAALTRLAAGRLPTALAALGLNERQSDHVALNGTVLTGPTVPAIERYTGVVYDALDWRGLTDAEKARAAGRIVVVSALFGAVRATDPIPAYRLSASARLPRLGPLAARWRPKLGPVLQAIPGLVVDLRSGAYAQLAPVPGAVTVRVLSVAPDGSRSVVSHFNKHAKGLLAQALATAEIPDGDGADAVLLVAKSAGFQAERQGPRGVDILLTPGAYGLPATAAGYRPPTAE
jgi:cytoplasmic iron level regulating protein YaaA (DUF328/UPF0246 family)